jgi:hypothetical protein
MKPAIVILVTFLASGCSTPSVHMVRQSEEFRTFVAQVQARWEEEIRGVETFRRPSRVTIWLIPRDGTLVFRDMVGGEETPQKVAKRAVEHVSGRTKFSPPVYDALRAKIVVCDFQGVLDPPNKAPEPTTRSVTPRATESKAK